MFNVGDRVITPARGVGTIVEITGEQSYLVVHDVPHPSLHCYRRSGSPAPDTCWWYYGDSLIKKKLEVGDKVITRYGKGVIAEIANKSNQHEFYLVAHNTPHQTLHNNNSEKHKKHTCWWYKDTYIKGDAR